MGKTNHRVNKDRQEKLSEAEAHKHRRAAKQNLNITVDYFGDEDDLELAMETFLDELDMHESIPKRRRYG